MPDEKVMSGDARDGVGGDAWQCFVVFLGGFGV